MPDPVAAPTNRQPGETLELTIPRIDGDALSLADLRGRVVVLEVSATWREDWRAGYGVYNELLHEHGDHLAAILISVDPERDHLSPEPAVRAPAFTLGWDPQGAVAAQLQLATFPTLLILDRDGRIAHIETGARPTRDQLQAFIEPLLPSN